MANGYQLSLRVKRGGKANTADAPQAACPQPTPNNPQNTPKPVDKLQVNNPSFFALFSKSVSIEKQYIYVYGRGSKAYALVSKTNR